MDGRGIRVGIDHHLVDNTLELGTILRQNAKPGERMCRGNLGQHAYACCRILGHDFLEQLPGVLPVK